MRLLRSAPFCALLAACSGGQTEIDNAETTSEPQLSATATAVVSSDVTPAPTSTGIDARGKLGKLCTQIGCRDQLVVQVPNVKLQPGSYTIAVEAEGKKSSCPLVVDANGMKSDGCQGDAKVALALPGSVPVGGAEGGFSLIFAAAPESVKVVVTTSAKKKLAEQTFTPAYKTFQPNGPDCGPTCKQGQETLQLK